MFSRKKREVEEEGEGNGERRKRKLEKIWFMNGWKVVGYGGEVVTGRKAKRIKKKKWKSQDYYYLAWEGISKIGGVGEIGLI